MSHSTDPPSHTGKLNPRNRARQMLLLETWKKAKAREITELRDLALLYRVSPGLPAQYLYGHLALNEKWMLRFALYLRVAPQHIWPDWEYSELTHTPLPDLILVNDRWTTLTRQRQSEIVSMCGP